MVEHKSLEEIRKFRLEKLEKLRTLGIDPYPSAFHPPLGFPLHSIARARDKIGEKISVVGRVWAHRGHGGLIFIDLRQDKEQIQLLFQKKKLEKNFDIINLFDRGDFIGASGSVLKTQAGEITIDVDSFSILTKSIQPLPEKHDGLKDVEIRYRHRYVDLLVNDDVRRIFEIRKALIEKLRNFLNEQGFMEVETPILQPLYGGATARPFTTHHNALDMDLYLRISDELYLKRLIVGGIDRVYEFCKDFRNEGISKQHNPEFTMLEFYWAYKTYEDIMRFTEEMFSNVIQSVVGSLKVNYGQHELDFSSSWQKISFRDLLLKDTGIDIDKASTEEKLLKEIEEKNIKLELAGVVGYAALLDEFYKKVSRPYIIQPTFVLNHPYQLRPLAKRLESDATKAASFSLVVEGAELINAYNELNDPHEQRRRWEDERELAKRGHQEHHVLDEDYITALEYGMPPTTGWGLGIDRLTMFLTNSSNIRDVILFPLLKPKEE